MQSVSAGASLSLRIFLEHSSRAVALLDQNLKYLAASSEWSHLHGLGAESLLGKVHFEVLPELPKSWMSSFQRCLRGSEEILEDHFQRASDGRQLQLRYEVRPWHASSEVIGGLVLFAQEVGVAGGLAPERILRMSDNLPSSYVFQFAHDAREGSRFLYLSAGVEQIHGLPMDQVMAHPELLLSQLDPSMTEEFEAARRLSLEQFCDFRLELKFSVEPGVQRWLLVHARPRQLSSGTLLWDGVATEISLYKQLGEDLKIHQLMLEESGRIARLGGWTFLVDTGEGFWSDEVARIHDLEPELVTNKELGLSFYTPESRVIIEAALERAISEGIPFDLELELITAKGRHVWVRTAGQPFWQNGRVVRLGGCFQDITSRKVSEECLRSQAAFLEAQLESNLDGILVVDRDGRKIHHNGRYQQIFKCFENEDWQAEVLSRAQDAQEFLRCVEFLKEHPEHQSREEMQLLDGTRLERYSSPVRGTHGQLYGRIWTFRDVTENFKLQDQLRQSQKMEAIGQLAGGVAHDFNNILAVISLQSETLLAEGGLTPQQLGAIQDINEAAQRAAELTRQLLLFSRRQSVQMAPLDLNLVLKKLAPMLPRLLADNIQLEFHYAAGEIPILGDSGLLDQVILNLAVNARDAMPKGGRLTCSTSIDRSDPAQAVMTISDTGEGIAPEVQAHIFEPFFTTKEQGKGTGLGLATVFGIVQQHQGQIQMQSQPGQGSQFTLTFPLSQKCPAVASPQAISPPPRAQADHLILVVEDEPVVREVVRRTLVRLGYQVLEAENGPAALRVFEERGQEVSLLLTDMNMPGGMSGRQLAQRLRDQRPDLKVIYSTGYSEDALDEDFGLDESRNFLAKPYSPKRLAELLKVNLEPDPGL